jgi:hypothetical protein
VANLVRNHWMEIIRLVGRTWKLKLSEISNTITIGFNNIERNSHVSVIDKYQTINPSMNSPRE